MKTLILTLTLKDVKSHFDTLNLNRYDLGGCEFVEDDFIIVKQRVEEEIKKKSKNNESIDIPAILKEKMDEYLYEVREIFDEGLEDENFDFDEE